MKCQLDKSQEQLLEIIGQELLGSSGLSFDSDQLITFGRNWFEKQLPHLRENVCTNIVTQHLLKNTDEVILIGAIVDIISSVCVGVTPATVATLIVKIGLKEFCN